MRENRGRQYISGLSKTFFAFFSEFVYGGLCFFQPKTFSIPRGMIPQNFSSLGFAVSQELGNKQTHTQTHSLTFYCFDRVIFALYSSQNIRAVYEPTQLFHMTLNVIDIEDHQVLKYQPLGPFIHVHIPIEGHIQQMSRLNMTFIMVVIYACIKNVHQEAFYL